MDNGQCREASADYQLSIDHSPLEEVPPGYKRTEVGVIPEDWGIVRLGSCLLRPPQYGINAPAVPLDNNLPAYIRITDITEEGRFDRANRASVVTRDVEQYCLHDGDIVFARTGASVGKSYLYRKDDGELVFAGFLIRITPNPRKIIPEYVAYFVQSENYWNWVTATSMRSGQPGINGFEYSQLLLPKPSVVEQRAIATALSDVDALITALDRLIAKTRAIKTAAMQQLLTGKTRLPGFSGEWEMKRLGDIAEIVMGQSPSSFNYNKKGLGLPLIQGNADVENRRTIKRTFTTQITKRGKSGDVLMSVRAPVGEISKAIFDVCLGRGVCAIRYPNDYTYHYLISREPDWARLSKGSTFESVNSDDVRALEVYLPSDINEQTAIAQVLSDMDAEIATLEARRDKTRAIKQGMMQQLLTGRVRLV